MQMGSRWQATVDFSTSSEAAIAGMGGENC
jgi:hypothetical protein